MKNNLQKISCPFCEGFCSFSYKLDKYDIWTCQTCGTGQTYPMPSAQELTDYYNGFLFATDPQTYPNIEHALDLLVQHLDLPKEGNKHMLDIGGGGGHYSAAFEKLNHGKACYIDLDPQSCEYARSLGLKHVIQGNVEDPSLITGQYDLIFARHLIEHLLVPTDFMISLTRYLKPNGKLILICPNGTSTEYRLFPSQILNKSIKILISNRFKPSALFSYFRKDIHHGMAPPRHLWAITQAGLSTFWNRTNYTCDLQTFSIDNPMVSPHFRSNTFTFLYRFLKKSILQKGKEAHLMCTVQKRTSESI